MTFLDKNTPNFVWKNQNAITDYDCIIESELPEYAPKPRIETTSIVARHGELHEWYGDYEAFDYPVKGITIPYERLEEVKRWLTGSGKLITHNDLDKYREAWCNMSSPLSFENEWGEFWNFDVTFRCQPLKRKINERPVLLKSGSNIHYDHGNVNACPFFTIDSLGGDITIKIADKTLTLLDTFEGLLTVDCELGKYIQSNSQQRSKGQWPTLSPGENNIILSGKIKSAEMLMRSCWR